MSKWKEPLKKTYCKELVEAFKEYDPSEPNSNAGKLDGLEQTFYKIKNSTCKPLMCRRNCKGNPLCLSGLGEAYWLTDSVESPDQETEDPTEERRKPGLHVGLRNLGATCYVNSLLQLWFHNPKFRRAVYDWNPLEDDVEQGNSTVHDYETYSPISEIGHLQVLFALMSCTERSYLDPTDFVESLGLDTSTQQDAQEFSKLYISLLEGRFNQQSLPHVQNMISDNFQGEYSYLTRCSKCNTESVSPSKFYELELNIMGHKTLDESLSEFLVEEKLEGADKYSCAVCCDKQEAVRFIELKTLPRTLNLQLMRFVYDRQKGYKKKINSSLQFPEVLNMEKYMKSKNDNDEELNYNLTAVLLHRGCSANSGHYIAYIKDSCGTWYVFNDQVVQKSEGKGLKLKFEESDDGTKPNSQRAPKGFFSSSKAYMLVYTKSNSNQPVIKKEQLTSKPDLCERLEVYIRRQNDKFKNWIEEETSVRKCCLASKNVLKQKMASIIQALPAGGDTWSSVEVIPVDWIKQWLRNATVKVEPIDNSAFVCSHNKLNPDCVGSVKYVHSETGSVLFEKYGGGPRLIGDQIPCRECIINKCKLFHSENKIKDHYNEIQTLLKSKMEENTPGFWVDKESLKRWRQYIRLNSDFPYCNEGYNTDGNEVLSSDLNSCIKEDCEDEMNLSTRLAVLNNSRRSCENISSKNENESYSVSKINGSSKDSNSVNCVGKEGFNGFSNSLATNKENNLSEAQSSIVQKNEMTKHHLFKNLAPTIPPNSVENVLNHFEDTLSNIMSLHHPLIQFIKSVSSDQEVLKNCKELESKSNLLSLQFKEVKSRLNDYHHNKQSSGWKEVYLNNCKRSRKSGEFPKLNLLGSRASQPDLRTRKECNFINNNRSDSNNSNSLHGDNVECSSEGENFSQNVCNSKDSRSAASSESCDEDSENDRINTCNVTRNNCEEFSAAVNCESECSEVNKKYHSERRQSYVINQVNDCEVHIPATDSENNCVKHEDDLEKYEEFNEAVVCPHGNLKIEESTRRLVPVKVWEILKQYFPLSVTFPNDAEPCRECLKLANENEQSKDVYRKQAATEKELLKDLFLGKNRPDLDKCHEITTFYIVPNEEFIMPWRQFIRRAGKVDPVTSLNTHLFICEHGGFQFCVERDAEKYVLLTESEWAALNSIYKGSQPVSISTIGDGATLTEPAECESCKKDRFEAEKLAMLDYENAVIYVQKVNEEVLPTTSEYDEDLSEPKNKKVKLSSSTPKSQFRRTSRRTRRKVRSETSIKVASTITLKDFKIKVMKQFDVIPSDQHLFDEDGRELTDNDLTLAELKLFPNSTIYLKVDEPTVSVDDSDSFSEEFSKNRAPEAGFKGTKLIS